MAHNACHDPGPGHAKEDRQTVRPFEFLSASVIRETDRDRCPRLAARKAPSEGAAVPP
jgi:hypothetical protein